MNNDEILRERLRARRIAREIHEMTYFKCLTGATESEITSTIKKVGNNRSQIARELRRQGIGVISYSHY